MVIGNRAKGIGCIVASAFGFALMAMFVRLCDDFGPAVSSFQKSFFRNVIAVVLAAGVFVRSARAAAGGLWRIVPALSDRGAWTALVLRSLLGTVGIFANFYAIGKIPIGEAMTLNKTAPFFTVLFAGLFLSERVTRRQVLALVVAFAGTVLVMKPGLPGWSAGGGAIPPAVWGLASGMCAGGAYACVRQLALLRVNGAFIVLFFSAFSCLAAVPFMVRRFDPMTSAQVLTLLGAGAGAAIGQFGITSAYRYAAPGSIAVFDYVNIVFTGAFGYFLFGQVPDLLGVGGFALILLAVIGLSSSRRGSRG